MTTFTAFPNQDGRWSATAYSNTINLLYAGSLSGTPANSYYRFSSVTIPAGATISTCVLTTTIFTGAGAGTLNLSLCLEDADNPSEPTTAADAGGRTGTTAVATFSGSRPANGDYNWPDFTGSAQEVIDRPGWASGQAWLVLQKDNASDSGTYTGQRSIENTGDTDDPYVTVNYTDPPAAGGGIPFLRRRTRTFQRSF